MKINNRIYRGLTGEPFNVQEVNGKQVEFFYMNDTPYLSQYVTRGRFYLWTSDGKNYRLLIEKGYYEKLDYFFSLEINTIWLGFLDEIGAINSKMTKLFLGVSLGIALVVVAVTAISFKEQLMIGVLIAFFATMVVNMFHTTRVNKIVRERNLDAQNKIKVALTEEGFNRLIKDQDEYIKNYFNFDDEEEFAEDELLETTIEEEVEVIEEKNEDK